MVGIFHITGASALSEPEKGILKIAPVKIDPKTLARLEVGARWNNEQEFACLEKLWERESHWNPKALNKASGAFGLAQFLPSTWGNYKYPYKPKDPVVQIEAGLRYIAVRYGTPCNAWKFWQRGRWY
jgi:resuscitation-promoting factor RpfB